MNASFTCHAKFRKAMGLMGLAMVLTLLSACMVLEKLRSRDSYHDVQHANLTFAQDFAGAIRKRDWATVRAFVNNDELFTGPEDVTPGFLFAQQGINPFGSLAHRSLHQFFIQNANPQITFGTASHEFDTFKIDTILIIYVAEHVDPSVLNPQVSDGFWEDRWMIDFVACEFVPPLERGKALMPLNFCFDRTGGPFAA